MEIMVNIQHIPVYHENLLSYIFICEFSSQIFLHVLPEKLVKPTQ